MGWSLLQQQASSTTTAGKGKMGVPGRGNNMTKAQWCDEARSVSSGNGEELRVAGALAAWRQY